MSGDRSDAEDAAQFSVSLRVTLASPPAPVCYSALDAFGHSQNDLLDAPRIGVVGFALLRLGVWRFGVSVIDPSSLALPLEGFARH